MEGFNLPIRIDNTQGCGVPLCGVDLCPNCQSSAKISYNFRSILLLILWKAPRQSKDHSTPLGTLWGARVPASQAYRPTRPTRHIVALGLSLAPQPVRPRALSSINTSVSLFQFPYLPHMTMTWHVRIKLPEYIRISLRRAERRRTFLVPFDFGCGLYRYFLSILKKIQGDAP